ncbi:hypothetical protein JBF11_06980 [Taurinivorans muris]|uniref:Uncharacterized protein n=1 Tax=Taurinivorans muris TaxID=2787751 RepID=A0ABY5XZF7_9BACT|nr:hypothetical protein JBF11_06980 [Desulfovibrionaceae bacterium LT0009]
MALQKTYLGVNNQPKQIKTKYSEVDKKAHKIEKAYVGLESGNNKIWHDTVPPIIRDSMNT